MIELKNINKSYGTKVVFENLNLKINDGEFVYLLGNSGAGKSTLLNILALFDTFDSGEYLLDNNDIKNIKNSYSEIRNKNFGFVFQSYCLIDALSVYDNIRLPYMYAKEYDVAIDEKIKDVSKRLGIEEYLDKKVKLLSGGEMQRVAFARAIINNPKYIFCDEPTGNLDETNTLNIMSLLHEVNKQGTTMIVVTHNIELVTHDKGGIVYEIKDKKLSFRNF